MKENRLNDYIVWFNFKNMQINIKWHRRISFFLPAIPLTYEEGPYLQL